MMPIHWLALWTHGSDGSVAEERGPMDSLPMKPTACQVGAPPIAAAALPAEQQQRSSSDPTGGLQLWHAGLKGRDGNVPYLDGQSL